MPTRPDHARIRSHSRHKINVHVLASTSRDGRPLKFTGTVVDVGLGGVTAQLSGDLELGESVILEFTLPYSQLPLSVQSLVRNRAGQRYGLQFLELTPDQQSAVQRLCDTLTLLEG